MTGKLRGLIAAGSAGLALAAATVPSWALGISIVKDPWALSEATATVKKLSDQYRTMVEQLAASKSQVAALTSHSGYGTLLNGGAEQSARRYMPDAWAAATNVSQLGSTNTATQSIVDDANRLYRPASVNEIDAARPDSDDARRYQKEVGTGLAVLAGSEGMLDRVGDRRATYETLLARVESTPDSKAAADLSNRIQAENGLTQNELLRATAMQANIAALQELRLASARAATVRAAARTRVNLSGGNYAPAS